MGKKPLDGVAKSGVLLVRLTAEERAELDSAATAAGEATSTWLRNLGLSAARAVPSKPAAKKRKPAAKKTN